MKKLHKLHNGDYIDLDSIVSINVFEKSRHPNGYNNIRDRVCIEYKSGNKSSVKTIYFDTYDEAIAYREKLAFDVNNRNETKDKPQ
jgi:hypothetical protein